MNRFPIRNRVCPARCLALVLALLFAAIAAHGQGTTSSALAGTVLDSEGAPLQGATVRILHEPTESLVVATTNEAGRYGARGLRVGGPYTVSVTAPGLVSRRFEGVFLQLAVERTLNVAMELTGDVFDLEAFVVEASTDDYRFNESMQGSSTTIGEEVLRMLPSIQRSISDITRLDSRVAVFDRDSGQLSAGGKNTRYNSLLIDGVPTNDSFGLSESGLPALKQPFSLEALSEVTVELSPYSVQNAGFTGAAISAITKSGTNDFRGSVFGYYRDDSMVGELYDTDPDILIPFNDFEEYTLGGSLGGPIIKDKLFFYVLYETVEETRVREISRYLADPVAIERIRESSLNFQDPFDPGVIADPDAYALSDDKLLIKLDWNVSSKHRLSARYNTTPGSDPRFGGRGTTFNTAFYDVEYGLDDFVGELFSNWSPNFATEARVSWKRQTRQESWRSDLPRVSIQDISDRDDDPGGAATVSFGQGSLNDLQVDTLIGQFKATWFGIKHTISAGLQVEQYDNYQLFLNSPRGNWFFRNQQSYSIALGSQNNGIPGTGVASNFSVQAPSPGQSGAADWTMAIVGAYLQDDWAINQKLNLTLGLRIDYPVVDDAPPVARGSVEASPRTFETVFGTPNTHTVDGNHVIQPRIGFNYRPFEDKQTQIRGGIGLFFGTAPHVWLSNAYVENGISKLFYSTNTNQVSPAFTLDAGEAVEWIIDRYGAQEATSVSVNYIAEDFKMPTEWKGNIAVDHKLPWLLDSTLTLEYQHSWTEYDVHYVNRNMNLNTTGFLKGYLPDGRELYTNTGIGDDRWREPGYRDVFELRNTDKGHGRSFTVELQRPMRANWSYRLGYTHTVNKTVNDGSSPSAYVNWASNVAMNPNDESLGTSSFETRHRIVGQISYQLSWTEKHKTTFSIVYDGRSGRPFSYLFGGINTDINRDGNQGNDLIYVPSDIDDPLVSWGDRNQFRDTEGVAFMAFVEATPGLARYKGQVAPRNTGRAPWIHQFDINITHQLLLWRGHKLELIFNIQNFGNLLNDKWGLEKRPRGSYGRAVNLVAPSFIPLAQRGKGNEYGYYVYRYPENAQASTPLFYEHPQGLASRWAMQAGLRYSF
jgi:hypothetical protein